MSRAMGEGAAPEDDGRFIRNQLGRLMWVDVNVRVKEMPNVAGNVARKQVNEMNEQFQAAVISYDEGLLGDDKALANALWHRFFGSDCDDLTKIEALVRYVRKTVGIFILFYFLKL